MKKVLLSLAVMFLFTGMVFAQQVINITTDVSHSVYGNGNPGNNGHWDSVERTPSNNEVTVTNAEVTGEVCGGNRNINSGSGTITISSNIVTITSATVGTVYGGFGSISSGFGTITVSNNNVTITNATVGSGFHTVTGGFGTLYSSSGTITVDNNNVTVTNTAVAGEVSGGNGYINFCSGTITVSNNNVTITSGTVFSVNGGFGNIYDGSGTVTVSNNIVTVTSATVSYSVYGGYACLAAGASGSATHNSVTIAGNANLSEAVISGGFVRDYLNNSVAGMDARTGNMLNVKSSGMSVKGIRNFENLNFYLPADMAADETMLTVTNAVDITGSEIGVGVNGGSSALNIGDRITLIAAIGGLTQDQDGTQASAIAGSIANVYTFDLTADGNNLYATAITKAVNKQTKILPEGTAAGAIAALQAADNINGALLSGLQDGKTEIFGSFFGGNSKYDTGSSVEMSAFGAVAGVGKKFNALNAGVFVEYASGSFDTQYGDVKGSGDASAIGGGLLVKKDIESVYIEGLARAGQVSNDYKTEIFGNNADFDYSSMYFGISLGGGKIFEVSENVNIDISAKYTLTNVSGGDADFATGDKYEFDAILSNRIKAGAKCEYKITEAFKPYLALAYDHEISGEVTAKINDMEIEAPTLNGGTFNASLGASAKLTESFSLDLGVNLLTGARSGVTGGLQAKWQF